ncbi:MAG: hypothetical protein BWY77_00960 [bacterium ADurb.Bin431]|nr:MAG: hypothetical protein BWY77_00960 [bacterium ADurb.Bin431]
MAVRPVLVADAVQGQFIMARIAADDIGGLFQPRAGPFAIIPVLAHPGAGRNLAQHVGPVPFTEYGRGLRPHAQFFAQIGDGLVIGGQMISADAGAIRFLAGAAILAGPPAHIIDNHLDRHGDHGRYSIDFHSSPSFAGRQACQGQSRPPLGCLPDKLTARHLFHTFSVLPSPAGSMADGLWRIQCCKQVERVCPVIPAPGLSSNLTRQAVKSKQIPHRDWNEAPGAMG